MSASSTAHPSNQLLAALPPEAADVREGITAAAQKLQRAGLIRYGRGRIQVLDRRGLEEQSCECYGVVRQAYERLRSGASAWPRPPGTLPGARCRTEPIGCTT